MSDVKREKALYWSSYDCYTNCAQRFLWKYGNKEIDLGAGLGKPKPGAKRSSEHHQIMGNTIQYAVERLYNDYLWQRLIAKDPAERWSERRLAEALIHIVTTDLERRLSSAYIEWAWAPSHREMAQTCIAGVIGFLKTMKANHLVGNPAKAEHFLRGYLNDVPVAARVDLILERSPELPLPGVTILDGKNSQEKGVYTSPDQLRFYALTYLLVRGKLPDRVGFVYYRFPYGTPTEEGGTESGIDWVPLDKEDIRGLAHKIVAVRESIREMKFDADPVPSKCKWCVYEDICAPRQAQKQVNREKRKKKGEEEAFSFNADELFTEID